MTTTMTNDNNSNDRSPLRASKELEGSWRSFLQKQNLSERLQDLITYSICLWDWSPQQDFPELSCPLP